MATERVALVLAGVVVTAALLVTLKYWLATPVVSDSIGYFQASYQLARGQGLAFADPNNQVDHSYYTLYSFKVSRPGEKDRYFSYPPGVPWLSALFMKLSGNPGAAHWLIPVTATSLVAVTFLLGSLFFGRWAGFWASIVLFAAPAFLQFSTSLWTEVPSAAFIYLGYLLYEFALRRPRPDLSAICLAATAILAVCYSFFMRFSNISLFLAVPAILWMRGGRIGFTDKRSMAFAAFLMLSLLSVMLFNAMYYGSPFTTGYSPTHGWYDSPGFSLQYAFGASFAGGHSASALAASLLRQLGWLLVAALIALLLGPRSHSIVLLALAFALLLPYAVYAFPADGINERFVVPSLPAFCMLVGRGITGFATRIPRHLWRWGLGVLLVAVLLLGLPSHLSGLSLQRQQAEAEITRIQDMVSGLEPNGVVLAYALNDLVAVYGKRSVLNYRHMPPYDANTKSYDYSRYEQLLVEEVRRLQDRGIPIYFIQDTQSPPYQTDEILNRRFKLSQVGRSQAVYRIDPLQSD